MLTTTADLTESAQLTETADLAAADGVTVTTEAEATPTQASSAETSPASDALYAGLPAEIAAFFPDQADPAAGEQVATANACSACHNMQEGVVQVGPSWYNLANTAATRVEGQSAALYLYTSIVAPNDHVVEGFAANLMPQIYADTLSDAQLADVIAYLLTLDGGE